MIASLDHLVLTTADEAACIGFYVELLGMELAFMFVEQGTP